MPRAFRIAYDGRRFKGSARQPRQRTVEGAIIASLQAMGAVPEAGNGDLASASRTDKGVSALGNIVMVDTSMDGETVVKAMNGSYSNEGLWFLGWADVGADFRPRHARERWYRYAYPLPTDGTEEALPAGFVDKMRETASLFLGEHDFKAFCKVDRTAEDRSTVRSIDRIDITPVTVTVSTELRGTYSEVMAGMHGAHDLPLDPPVRCPVVLVDIRGRSFLWQMVRRLTAAMVGVASGGIAHDDVEEALGKDSGAEGKGGRGPKGKAFKEVLPAENLILMDVVHDLHFEKVDGLERLVRAIREDVIWPLMNDAMFYDQVKRSL